MKPIIKRLTKAQVGRRLQRCRIKDRLDIGNSMLYIIANRTRMSLIVDSCIGDCAEVENINKVI